MTLDDLRVELRRELAKLDAKLPEDKAEVERDLPHFLNAKIRVVRVKVEASRKAGGARAAAEAELAELEAMQASLAVCS